MTTTSELAHLFRALKAPAAARALPKLADRAREESWSYERFTEALLSTEVASRESHGGESRIKAARFPARKTLEEFDFTFQRSVKRQVVEHLGPLDFLQARDNVVLLGPPGTGKTHLAIAIGIRACLAGQRVAFATATEWVARLSDAKRSGGLDAELRRLGFIPLLVVDEVGYIPFDPEAANLMFGLVSARYERASLIVTSNKPFSAWGEIFGDEVVAVAMIDRPPRRDPVAQGRLLSTARQGPRRPTGRREGRNRLIDHRGDPPQPPRSALSASFRPRHPEIGPDRSLRRLLGRSADHPAGRSGPPSGSRARPLRLAYGSPPRTGTHKVGAFSTGTGGCVFNRP
jgi:DNA replication protein DnaC